MRSFKCHLVRDIVTTLKLFWEEKLYWSRARGWDTMSFKHLLYFILKCGSSNCDGRNLLFTSVVLEIKRRGATLLSKERIYYSQHSAVLNVLCVHRKIDLSGSITVIVSVTPADESDSHWRKCSHVMQVTWHQRRVWSSSSLVKYYLVKRYTMTHNIL